MSNNLDTARRVKALKMKTRGIHQAKRVMNEDVKLNPQEKFSWNQVEKILDEQKKVYEKEIRKLTK